MRRAIGTSVLVLACSCLLSARAIRVPGEYPTIQGGLDNVSAGDTVLVAIGLYEESLHAPALPLVLKGDVVPDTGAYPRPVIDPSPLANSDSLACMIVPAGCVPVIEDFVFRNGPEMFPRRHPWSAGGVVFGSGSGTFRRCVFDSTYEAIRAVTDCALGLEYCRFLDVYESVRAPLAHVALQASDCIFTGRGWAHVQAYGDCRLERCQFGPNEEGPACEVTGHVAISNCIFGPNAVDEWSSYPCLQLFRADGVVEDNLFSGIRMGWGFLQAQCPCDGSARLVIRRNFFVHSLQSNTGYPGIGIQCQGNSGPEYDAEVDSNRFEDNHAAGASVRAIACYEVDALITNNRFSDLWIDSAPPGGEVPVIRRDHFGRVTLRGNHFEHAGLAVQDGNISNADTFDLRENWWGDATGPFHSVLNPAGRGDTVISDHAVVTPWCVDTLCGYADDLPERKPPSTPSGYLLLCSPNPFNTVATFRLTVPQPEIVRVDLFDMLGRIVQEVWSGLVADEKSVRLDGTVLASGVYVVRVTNAVWNRPLVSTKIVLLK